MNSSATVAKAYTMERPPGSAHVSGIDVGCFTEHPDITSPGLRQDSLDPGPGLPMTTPQH